MKRMLFNATYAEELRVASVEGQRLINFDIETSSKEQRRGNIYKGFITRVEPSLEACFVDYGTEKQGFLPFKEIDYRYLPEVNGQRIKEFAKLPVGTELIVQVEKDERGNKGAALTSYVTLPGRYLVLMPNNSRAGGISRRIEGEERDELKSLMAQLEITHGMSVILRTAALGRVIEELQWDLTYLLKLWDAIQSAAAEQKGSFLIYQESSLVIRSIRDHFTPDILEVLIDTEEVYTQARQFMLHVMPHFAERIKLYRDDVPLFSRFQIEHQIESAYARAVHLPSGGSIVIDHTEALTAVDVNSAKANKGADIEATAFATNLEAAEEIARQLRLRDLGGLVVVDFIDMENQKNQRELENHFKNQLGYDRARIQMGKLSRFGLLELSRQRLQSSLDESSTIACPRCCGVGTIRGIESTALHVLRIIQEEVVKAGSHLSAFHVQLPVDVATYLLNERRDDVAKIEARMKVRIVLVPNVHLDSPNYKIKKLNYDTYDSNFNKSSYNLVETPEETLNYKSQPKNEGTANKLAVVQNIAPAQPAPIVEKKEKSSSGIGAFFAKIGAFFAAKPAEAPKPARNNVRVAREGGNKNYKNRNSENSRGEKNSTRTSERSNERPNGNTGNNKLRPVPVTKSNDKIQTVRPNQSNNVRTDKLEAVTAAAPVSAATPVNSPAVKNEPQRNNDNRDKPQNQQRRNNQSNRNNSNRNTEGNGNRIVQHRPSTQLPTTVKKVRESAALTPVPEVDRLNIAASAPGEYLIFTASGSGAAVGAVIHSVAKEVVQAPAKPAAEVVKTEATVKVVPKPPVVSEPINLGDLQLVATNAELLNQPVPEIILANVKRHSDVPREEKIVDLNLVFEQVETKN